MFIFTLLFAITLPTFAKTNEDTQYGISYTKNNEKYSKGKKIKGVVSLELGDLINGSFINGNKNISFSANKIDTIEKEQIYSRQIYWDCHYK